MNCLVRACVVSQNVFTQVTFIVVCCFMLIVDVDKMLPFVDYMLYLLIIFVTFDLKKHARYVDLACIFPQFGLVLNFKGVGQINICSVQIRYSF